MITSSKKYSLCGDWVHIYIEETKVLKNNTHLYCVQCILFCSVLVYSILLSCVVFCSILFYSIRFDSIRFYSILFPGHSPLNRFHYCLMGLGPQFVKTLARWIWVKQLPVSESQRTVFFWINTSVKGLEPKQMFPEFSSPLKPPLTKINDSCKVTRHQSSSYFHPWPGS